MDKYPDAIPVGERISALRKSYRMSQPDLAEVLGCSRGHISHLETGRTYLNYEEIRVLTEHFQVTPYTLLRMSNENQRLRQKISDVIKSAGALAEQTRSLHKFSRAESHALVRTMLSVLIDSVSLLKAFTNEE